MLRALWCLFALLCSGCLGVRYVAQAAAGQWELSASARDIDNVIADPATEERTRQLLREVEYIKRFAVAQGLDVTNNYQEYVQLDRPYVVWFVNASAPLAFVPETFWFPFFGTFPGLGWFHQDAAEEFASELREEGWDVNIRGVSAYSTGGWFDDPIVSSMFADGDNAVAALVNVVLHESVHATVLVQDQQFYNESLASFVANAMTSQYLRWRFGERSEYLRLYEEREREQRRAVAILQRAYRELDAVYQSAARDGVKQMVKRERIADLERQFAPEQPINNATLIGVQLYQMEFDEMSRLYSACGKDWRRFLRAAGSVESSDFDFEQQDRFGSVLIALRSRGCPQALRERPRPSSLRWQKTPAYVRRLR